MWWVRDATGWKQVTAPVLHDGAAWRAIVRGMVYDGTAWRRFYPDSEVTVTNITSGLTPPVPVGVARTVAGTVQAVSGTVSGGTVTVYQRTSPSGAWVSVGTATVGTGALAPWSASVTPTICGLSDFKAVYSGNATYQGSESAITTVTTTVNAPAKMNGDSIANTSATFSWTAVAGATGYEFYRDGVKKATLGNVLTYTDSGLAQNTAYSWTLVATIGACKSTASPAKTGKTGQAATMDTGSTTIEIRPEATNSYRPDVDWGYIGEDVGQGYYSNSGSNYTGCIDYGTNTQLKNKVVAALGANGSTRWDNLTVSAARVYMHKISGVGTGGTVTMSFYNSPQAAGSGGAPARNGTVVNVTSESGGSGDWASIGTAHWTALKNGSARSIVLYNFSSSQYSRFEGKSKAANRCNLQLDCSWNYQLTAAVTPGWTN